MTSTKYRVEVSVRLLPLDTNLPIASRTFEVEGDERDSSDRVFKGLTLSTKTSEAFKRVITEVYGEEPL